MLNTNTSRIVSFFSKDLSRTTNLIRQKTKDNIQALYLFLPTSEASWTVKNMNVVNEIIGVV